MILPWFVFVRAAMGLAPIPLPVTPSAIVAPRVTVPLERAAAVVDVDVVTERVRAWVTRAGVLAARLSDRVPVKVELVQALEEARLAIEEGSASCPKN